MSGVCEKNNDRTPVPDQPRNHLMLFCGFLTITTLFVRCLEEAISRSSNTMPPAFESCCFHLYPVIIIPFWSDVQIVFMIFAALFNNIEIKSLSG